MSDRFDDAKRALEGVPAPDVWGEAERRAADGTVVPLAAVSRPPRRTGRWLAAAAVLALLVGTVAVLADDGDPTVDAGDATPGSDDPAPDPSTDDVTIYQADGACKLGMVGKALPEPAAVSPAETYSEAGDGEPVVGTLVEGRLNEVQTYAVQVPGQVVTDLIGERVEEVQIERGTATLWFQSEGAVQLRWFTGSQEPCESFTVTVDGGSDDEDRHAAVDLGERVLIGNELPTEHPTPGGNPLRFTEWQLERSTVGGVPTEGSGSLFTFTDADVFWTDGCNDKGAAYRYDDGVLVVDEVTTTDVFCDPNPTSDAINSVMSQGQVAVTLEGGELRLRSGTVEVVLIPKVVDSATTLPPSTTTTVDVRALVGLWEIVELSGGTAVPAGEVLAEFSDTAITWTDGCTGHGGDATYHPDGSFTLSNVAEDGVECPADPGRDLINSVFTASVVEAQVQGDSAQLSAGGDVIVLQRR
jgi:hypothetical protein